MKVISSAKELHEHLSSERFRGRSIGFVPTMGALHEGHLCLIRKAVRETEVPVVSIFVNPTQFGPHEDLDKYPRQEKRDLELCAAAGARVAFLPSVEEVYPPGYRTEVEVTQLSNKLCGATRPGHFRGVTTVVNRLFHLVQPHQAFFGLKDRQQFLILCRMVEDMGWTIRMVGVETVREEDGLALSSRNAYLSPEERRVAPRLYEALRLGLKAWQEGQKNPSEIQKEVRQHIEQEPLFKIDYVEVVRPDDLETPETVEQGNIIALAACLGKARLIDNVELV
jgi:pantoate--beta-alanine ligase